MNFGSKWPRWSEIADFRSLFARSDSAITPSEKSSININRKSTTRFRMSQRWTSYVFIRKRKLSEIWTISCDNSETVRDRMELLLITNRKSHMGFRLVPTSMTLNAVIAFILRFFHRIRQIFRPIISQWLKRPIMSVKYRLPVPVFYFWRKL